MEDDARERERSWVERARNGDDRAFREVYDLAFRLVWAYVVRSTGDPKLAEAVTARALRRLFASLADFDGRTSLGGFALARAEAELRALKGDACPPFRTRDGTE